MHPILEMSLLRSQTLGEGTPITPPFSFPCHRPPDAGPLFYLLVPPLHHGLRSVSQATSSLTPASICCQASVPHQKDLPLLGMHLVAFSKFQKGDKNRRLPSESCISSISQFPQVLLWDWGHTENPLPWWSWTPTESMGPLFGRVLISNLAGTKWTIEDEKKRPWTPRSLGVANLSLNKNDFSHCHTYNYIEDCVLCGRGDLVWLCLHVPGALRAAPYSYMGMLFPDVPSRNLAWLCKSVPWMASSTALTCLC